MLWRLTVISIIKVLMGTNSLLNNARNKLGSEYKNLDEVETEMNKLNQQLASLLPILTASKSQQKKENPLNFKDVFDFDNIQ